MDETQKKAIQAKLLSEIESTQKKIAERPPRGFKGVCLDGRDITYNIMPNADVKFFMTASTNVRAKRRFEELKKLNHKISYKEVINSIKARDKSDFTRKISPLKKTKDSILIDSSNMTIKKCFIKMKNIILKKI